MRSLCIAAVLGVVTGLVLAQRPVVVAADDHDWPTYNRDAAGTRHNPAERSLSAANVGTLVEKWRYPAANALQWIGVVGATSVVNGHTYFGTLTMPTVYKLTPEGKLKWSYQNADAGKRGGPAGGSGLPTEGFANAPLVTDDTVFIGDLGGWIFALDRATGKERWKLDTRGNAFPGGHPSNCIFSSPILAEGHLIVAGGGYEHGVAADPKHRCCTGRGFVVALDPRSGKVAWKYDVGPEPRPLEPPITMRSGRGERVYHFGPSTSSVWCTPSFDAESHSLFFGTDTHNSPRQPTTDDPRMYTEHSCAVIALDARSGAQRWVAQVNPDDVWNYSMPAYDPTTGRYKDQSIGDTPKLCTIDRDGRPLRVVGCGCKNGGFYVLNAATGKIVEQTPLYTGPPKHPIEHLDPRVLALPGAMGGLQTGCATDGRAFYTNGTDILGMASSSDTKENYVAPTGGRVVSLSLDTKVENWRHERPKVAAVGGTKEKPAFTNVGDPVASGIALANGVAYFTTVVSNRLVAVDTTTGRSLKEIPLGPVWCGPVVSRGRVVVGTGNVLFAPLDPKEAYFPKSVTGSVRSFGLPGEDATDRLKGGDE